MENKSLLYPCASAARRVISLDGMWRFEFDPESNGMDAGWDVGLPKPISMPVPASFCDFFTDKESREYCGDSMPMLILTRLEMSHSSTMVSLRITMRS